MKLLSIFLLLFFLFAPPASSITIEWWQFWTDANIKPVINSIIEEFEKANPDIEVNVTELTWSHGHEKIVLAFESGNAPDIVELGSDWIAQFAYTEQLADMTDMVTDDSINFKGWGMSTYENKIFAHPWILGTRVLFFNRSLMLRAGYDGNFIPITWMQLFFAANKIDALDKDIHGWGSNTAEKHRLYKKFMPFFWSARAQIFSDDNKYCVLPSLKGVSALTFYKKLHDSCSYVSNQRGIEDAFLEGKIGFILSGDWLLKRIENENRNIDLMSTLMPGPGSVGRSFLGGEFLAIAESSDNKEAALKFIKFLTSPENQLKFCKANRTATPSSVVASQDSYFSSNPHLKLFNQQILSAIHPPVDPDWVKIEDIIERAVEEVLFRNGPVAGTLKNAQEKIEKLKYQ